ncbi:MAG: alpha/beta hydrolase [Betaproteobacteria bacterium]|nr:alpha/beta hydrolase [Betaproteobacteria bacterium]
MNKVFSVTARDGTTIGCVIDGQGPPLLMIHGTGDTHLGWRRIRRLLAAHFTLYLMDRRGRGVSGDHDEYALSREWEDVAAMIDSIPEPVNVFAHSFGAMCALEGALSATNIRRMCIYEPSVNRNASNPKREFAIEEMARLITAGDRDGVVEIHLRNIINVSDDTLAKQRDQREAWDARLAMAHTMPRELLALRNYQFDAQRFAKIGVPLRLLLGEKSVGHGPDTARSLAMAVRGAEFIALEGQGHFAMLTAPELLAAKLIEFFQSHEAAQLAGQPLDRRQ